MDGEIGTEELRSLLARLGDRDGEGEGEGEGGDGEVRIVDVRSPRAFGRGHLPGSENVPLPRLVDDVERFAGADRVVTVCPHGKSSVGAARLIAAYEGFDGRVESYAPGLAEWDGPVEASGAGTVAGASDGEPSADGESGDEGPAAPF